MEPDVNHRHERTLPLQPVRVSSVHFAPKKRRFQETDHNDALLSYDLFPYTAPGAILYAVLCYLRKGQARTSNT
jgi:hypothetical protein